MAWKRNLIFSAMAFGLAVTSAGCGSPQKYAADSGTKGANTSASNANASAKVVKTTAVQKTVLEDQREVSADIVPFMELNVVVKADGDVVQVLKKRGETVAKDEPILEIDKTDILREKEKVDAGLATAREQLEKAKKDLNDSKREIALSIEKAKLSISDLEQDYAKLQNDYDKGLVNKSQLSSMETRLNQARMDLDLLNDKQKTLDTSNPLSQAEYQLRTAQIAQEDWERALSYQTAKAPIAGLLTYMPAEVGMTLQRGVTIGKVQQLSPVKIKAQLTDSQRQLLQDKTEVSFHYPSTGEDFKGTVAYLATTADQQTKTYELELEAANDQGKLKPGSRVQLKVTEQGPAESLTVPADAVLTSNDGSYLFIVEGDHAVKRAVTTGKLKENQLEITKGLAGGEQVVVSGQHRLADGEAVSVQK